MFRLTRPFDIGPYFKTDLSFHKTQCITTSPACNNFRKSEQIQTYFRSIIQNLSPVKLPQFPRVSYIHVVRRRISARIKWTSIVTLLLVLTTG